MQIKEINALLLCPQRTERPLIVTRSMHFWLQILASPLVSHLASLQLSCLTVKAEFTIDPT